MHFFFSPADFAVEVMLVTFPPDATSVTIDVAVTDDVFIEETEHFSVVLQNPSLGRVDQTTGAATVSIDDNDGKEHWF